MSEATEKPLSIVAAPVRPTLLVLTSTYPRWHNDSEPGFVHELAKRLAEKFQVIVLSPHAPGALLREMIDGVEVIRYRYAPERFETLVNDGGIIANLRANKWKLLLVPGFIFAHILCARRLLNTHRVDVIHAHWFIPAGFVAACTRPSRHRIKVIVTSHGSDVFGLTNRVWKWLRAWISTKSCRITAVGQKLVKTLDSELDRTCLLMPMGVDLSGRFFPISVVERKSKRMLFVGRLISQKRPDLVLETLSRLRRIDSGYELDVIGSGPMLGQLQSRASEADLFGVVHFHGQRPQSQIVDFYRQASFTVIASGDTNAPEGLGLVVVEALGCGCAVVAPANESLSSMLPDCARIEFVDEINADAFANAVRKLELASGTDGAVAIHENQRLREMFDWPFVAKGYADLIDDVLREKTIPESNR